MEDIIITISFNSHNRYGRAETTVGESSYVAKRVCLQFAHKSQLGHRINSTFVYFKLK